MREMEVSPDELGAGSEPIPEEVLKSLCGSGLCLTSFFPFVGIFGKPRGDRIASLGGCVPKGR